MFTLEWNNYQTNLGKKRKKPDDDDDSEDNHVTSPTDGHHHSDFIRTNKTDLYFYTGISKTSICELQKETQKIVDNIVNKAKDAELFGFEVTYPPIKLHIHSPGGVIFSAFSYIDFVTQLKLKNPKIVFHTIIEGGSASAATLISVTGDKRFMTEYAYMLIHQLSSGCWGKYNEIKDDMKNNKELMNRIKSIYEKHSNIPKSDLNKILKHDIYWNAEACLDRGLVDEIITI